MKSCGEKITDQMIVERILKTLTARFDFIAIVIEESRNLEFLKVEELQGSLEAHEQRLSERTSDKSTELVLQVKNSIRNE